MRMPRTLRKHRQEAKKGPPAMPITQDRMIAVINAGRECLECYKALIGQINEAVKQKRMGLPAEQVLENLLVLAYEYQPSMSAIEVIAVEETHFAAMRHHNELSRQRMAEQRIQQRGFSQRHPRETSVRHRIAERKAELAMPKFEITQEEIDRLNREYDAEQKAKAAKPAHENPNLYRAHDAEAVEVEEVWKDDPNSIIGS